MPILSSNRHPTLKPFHDDNSTSAAVDNATAHATTNNYSEPTALRAFHTYQKQHSQAVLLEEYDRNVSLFKDDRKFAVAYFWCPQRLGNILHSFFNTIAWAMIHNRTVLWKYHDSDQVSSQQECEELLKLAQWFPSFDEWEEKLPYLTDAFPVSLVNFSSGEEGHPVVIYPQISDVLSERKDIVRHGWIEDPSHDRHGNYLKSLPPVHLQTGRDLYSEGKSFLYGMLYDRIFELTIPSQMLVFGQNMSISEANPPLSIAVHSRHPVGADDGSHVQTEIKCLDRMIASLKKDDQPCEVLIMSDRSKTIDLLIEWLLAKKCSVVTANHTLGPKINDIAEHGPWSGAGFLLDLQIMGAAESGVMGDPHRSSTALVIYQVDYNRRMRAFQRSGVERLSPLPICTLPNKPLSGYSYGSETPTFRHHSHLAPLEPIGVLDAYKNQPRQGYVLSKFDFEKPSYKTLYGALNSFLYAIMTNRSFVLLDNCEHQCVDDRSAIARKRWMADVALTFSEENDESLAMENLFFESDQFNLSVSGQGVLNVEFEEEYYSELEWKNAFRNSAPDSQVKLEQLFARGRRFLYGLLFHELFDIYERIEPPWNESPSASIVVDLESSSVSFGKIEECLAPMIPKPGFTSPEPCHIFLVKSGNKTNDLELDLANKRCTSSAVELPKSDNLDKSGFRILDFVARARTGWVSPKKSNICPSLESLIQERIEFYRYRETWKLGRDPFFIQDLHECKY